MINKNKWIYEYLDLNQNSQLEIAEAIIRELSINESDEKDYDEKKSNKLKNLFYKMKLNIEHNKELKIFDKYENLSDKNKNKVIHEMVVAISKCLSIEEKEEKEKICEQEGHLFTNWEKEELTTYMESVIDHDTITYPEKHIIWTRKCNRCGTIDKVYNEPQELIDERKDKNKKKKIKRLENELKKLKNE